jgi:hypothetical protein
MEYSAMCVLKRKMFVLAVLGALLASVGCEDNRRGVVIETQKRQGFLHSGFESEVTVRRADGSTTTLGHVGNPFYVITFVEVPPGDPAYVDPRIERLAKRFELDSVAVIQMSIPKAKETFSEEAIAEANLRPIYLTNLSRFLDPDRRAWRIFGQPEPQTILLVDRRGVFGSSREKGTLDEPRRAILAVEWMQREWEIDEREKDIRP